MKIILIVIPLFLNIWIVLFQLDSFLLPLLASLVVGLYKGNQSGTIKSTFNLYKVNYSLRNQLRLIELIAAILLSLSTDILSIVQYLTEGFSLENTIYLTIILVYSGVFGFIIFRFLLLNLLQEHYENKNLRF
ncbi:hypothetical protein JOC75_000628 [Metabacillus crassostreae]|uniref:hypothetical protein n=1 Tax=Metabacillus crassostreae TaxID=929098 RepID=UPI00195DA593|nr:hypothetical protein [Metabacillus crassostreae]MBM7602658.1 hypothetical protein [Metabacillus crassostreae]